MKKLLLITFLLLSPTTSAVPRIELSSDWLKERVIVNHSLSLLERTKKTIAKLEKESGGRYNPNYDDSNWTHHHIPGPENPPPDCYQGGTWYRRKFTIPTDYKDKFFRLQFEGVNYIADVWINGKWVGSHEGGYTPFSFDITPYIAAGSENTIAVRVDNIPWDSRNDIVPYKTCDWWNYGGITRDVYIEVCEKVSIANAYVRKDSVKIEILNHSGGQVKTSLKIKIWRTKVTDENITDPRPSAIIDGENPIVGEDMEVSLSQTENEIIFKIPIKNLDQWSPQNPNLYVLEVSLDNGDTYYTQFGIRDVKIKSGRLFLNNKLIYLNGAARHEVFGATTQDLYKDLKTIKEMNVNFLRTAHYPNEPQLYILTDRMGILVWEEIPVYWFGEDGFNIQKKRKIAENMWIEMIKRDFNRPSIIFWGTCNECETQDERKEFIKRLYNLAYSIDGTRLVAQSAVGSDPMDMTHQVCDVIGVTMYYGIFYGKDYYKDTLKALEIMHSAFPEKPIIVTEYGTWSGLDLSLAQKQVKVAEETLKAIFEKPYVVGWTWWCAFDWFSMITTFQTMGTITMDRENIKPVYYYLQKIYGNKLSPLEVEIIAPYNYATVRGIVEIKTKVKSSYEIEEITFLINGIPQDLIWDTRKLPDGEYILTLKARDSAGVTQVSTKKVFVDNIDDPPDIKINLNDGDILMHKKLFHIKTTDDRSPPMDIKTKLLIDGIEHNPRQPWNLDQYPDKSIHTVTVVAEDGNKNIQEKIFTVTIDNSPGIYVKLPYNHDWISWDINMSDGTGWDFPAEELPEGNLDFIYNEHKFYFGDKQDGKMNNTECLGQKIDVPVGNYKNLYLLSASHDGSSSGNLTLIYEDGSRETIFIAISDWWGAMPMFGEELAIKCTHHHERNEKDNPPGVGIYLRKISVNPNKKLKVIQLPEEPKMHIFCISLE